MEKEAVMHWLKTHEEDQIQFLQQMIRIPSVTGNEGPIQNFMAQTLREMGLEVDSFVPSLKELQKHPAFVAPAQDYDGRPNVVGILKGTGGGKSLLFNGHIDVIPEGSLDNWEHQPWSADIENGKMYGRGTSDMKSGAAAMTMAVKAIRACGVKLKGDVILEYVMDEELTGNGTLACVMKGYKADAGICCETSSMCVQPGSIGRIWFTINIKGKAAGIQKHREGISGIDLGYLVCKAVEEYEALRMNKVIHPLYPDIHSSIPCAIGEFDSGTYNSAFPDSCVLKGSMATVPSECSDAVKRDFVQFITERVSSQHPWFKEYPPEIIFTGYFAEPSEIPVDSPIVQALVRQFKDHMKREPIISGRQGAADIRHMNMYGNTPTVIFGPGSTEQMHANNEWVSIQDYLDSVQILACTILDWCNETK